MSHQQLFIITTQACLRNEEARAGSQDPCRFPPTRPANWPSRPENYFLLVSVRFILLFIDQILRQYMTPSLGLHMKSLHKNEWTLKPFAKAYR